MEHPDSTMKLIIGGLLILGFLYFHWRPSKKKLSGVPESNQVVVPEVPEHLAGFVNWLLQQVVLQTNGDPRQDQLATARVVEAALKAAQTLETVPQYEIDLPFLFADAQGPKHFKLVVSRDDLARATRT